MDGVQPTTVSNQTPSSADQARVEAEIDQGVEISVAL
jgi:hypothetical protein